MAKKTDIKPDLAKKRERELFKFNQTFQDWMQSEFTIRLMNWAKKRRITTGALSLGAEEIEVREAMRREYLKLGDIADGTLFGQAYADLCAGIRGRYQASHDAQSVASSTVALDGHSNGHTGSIDKTQERIVAYGSERE